MEQPYQYPIFFECHEALLEQKKKVETYFRVRRKSGGGDCGPLTTVAEYVYSISFRYLKDQQEVLKRCKHVLELEGDRLVLIVRDSLESPSTSHNTDSTTPAENLQSISASTAPPSVQEYELQFDDHPSEYLVESPNTDPADWKALVMSQAQPGAVDEVSDWKAHKQVDGYSCQNEDNPDKGEELFDAEDMSCLRESLSSCVTNTNNTPSHVEFQVDAAGATGGRICLEIVQGTIETQQVDALASPMVGHDPLSTVIGNILNKKVGFQLTSMFRKARGDESFPGDSVLLEGLPGLPSNALHFLNLIPWMDDMKDAAVEVLRLGINNILTSCEEKGFGSVALPLLGTGIALCFPTSVVARVILEEVHAFDQKRTNSKPLLVRIVIHPNDEEASEVFKSVQEEHTKETQQPYQYQASSTKRVILLGKTGSGKSHLANTIIGEDLFTANHSPNSGTKVCQAETKSVNGRSLTLIDTPGFFDTEKSEADLKPEIMSCITECAPGPHAFLIVLRVDKFSKHEQEVVTNICQYFSEDALKYAVIVFTHGDQLPKGVTIEKFVSQNQKLSDLVKSCGGRCHVFDSKYWKNNQQGNYRSNHFQLELLLCTIDEMVMEKNGLYYTNDVLQDVEKKIQKQEEQIRKSSGNLSPEEIRKQAKTEVTNEFLIQLAGTATGALLGAFFGVAALVEAVIRVVKNPLEVVKLVKRNPLTAPAAFATGGEVAIAAGVIAGVTTAAVAATGGVMGGMIGHDAAKGAKTPMEAAERAVEAVMKKKTSILNMH